MDRVMFDVEDINHVCEPHSPGIMACVARRIAGTKTEMFSSGYGVQRLTVDDAPRCLEVSQAVGWTHDLSVWQQMISLGGEGSLCVRVGDTIVATNIATMYGA